VHYEPLILPPVGFSWAELRREASATLREAREELAPRARTAVETDFSVPRALHRVIKRERRDLLVVGSSRRGPDGRVRIGKRTRQLLCQFECPLAIAPRGYRERYRASFRRVGVGYDGGNEAQAALALAASIALGSGAEIELDAVVDDRFPPVGWSPYGSATIDRTAWEEAVLDQGARRREEAEQVLQGTGAPGNVAIHRGRPAKALLALSGHVDVLVVGSRRWGPVARVLLGSTGEALLHDAACPVIVVPRPAH
jgi:nucleotide-binding universal stress UspA family protein